MVLLSYAPSYGQKENNVWYVGYDAIIDFNSSPPTLTRPTTGTLPMAPIESSASISDEDGHLLFYSDGKTVWDRTNVPMPGGTGLLGNELGSATQGVYIVPFPGNTTLYYLFVLDAMENVENGSNAYLRYSLVDMSLNGGLGDVVSAKKNIIIDSLMSEKMCVARGNDCGFWLITHKHSLPEFHSFHIGMSGINTTPVVSSAGLTSGNLRYAVGYMKLSSSSEHIALITRSFDNRGPGDIIEYGDFDKTTGVVSGILELEKLSSTSMYGLEFSPGNSKLYVTCPYAEGLVQYDLGHLPSVPAVRASRNIIVGKTGFGGIRKGPGGKKIYTRRVYSFTASALFCINEPDSLGAASRPDSILTIDNAAVFGLNTEVPSTYDPEHNTFDTTVCLLSPVTIQGPVGFDQYEWSTGERTAEATLESGETIWVKATKDCRIRIDTFNVVVRDTAVLKSVTDTVICFQQTATLETLPDYEGYLWNDGIKEQQRAITKSGTYSVTAHNNEECTLLIDTFRVTFTDFDLALADTALCQADSLLLDATVPGASYLWQDGTSNPTYLVRSPGTCFVDVTVGACTLRDTVEVYRNPAYFDFGPDAVLCEGKTLVLKPAIAGAEYLWSDGSTGDQILVDQSGTYSVTLYKLGCRSSDTINIAVKRCDDCIVIPNAFTPDGNTLNDVFKPIIFCAVKQYIFRVFNRYGQEIFSTSNTTEGWNGTFNGVPSELGVYYYMTSFLPDYPGAKETLYSGDVSLIR